MHNCKRPASHHPVEVKLLFLGVRRLMPPATFFRNSQDHRKSPNTKENLK